MYRVAAEVCDVVDESMRLRMHVEVNGSRYSTEELIPMTVLLDQGAPDYLLEVVLKSVSDYVRYELAKEREE